MRTGNQLVLDRVIVDVVEIPLKLIFIVNRVFPEATLPDVTFTVLSA